MKCLVRTISILLVLTGDPALAQFSGQFQLGPPGCQNQGECVLTYDLRFKDSQGIDWLAKAQDRTDGATIPPWAQLFIGGPFDESYIKAAVIHDHYCDRHVRPWRQTHRAFYDALQALGVPDAKAKVMYYAVYLGGPKWVNLIPGQPCGGNCVFRAPADLDVGVDLTATKPVLLARPADYDQAGFVEELKLVEQLVADSRGSIDLRTLEKRAESRRANDFYYKNGDTVRVPDQLGLK